MLFRSRPKEALAQLGPGAVLLAAFGLVVSAAILSSVPVRTTFQVAAETEIASGVSASKTDRTATQVAWRFEDASICAGPVDPLGDAEGCAGTPVDLPAFTGLVEVRSRVAFEVERIASGPLTVALLPIPAAGDPEEPFLVTLYPDDEPAATPAVPLDEPLPPPVLIQVVDPQRLATEGRPVSLPLLAERVTFGREASRSSLSPQAMLRSGIVSILGWDVFGSLRRSRRIYLASTIDLRYGDEITAAPAGPTEAEGAEPSETNPISVLLRVDERPALQAVFQTRATEISIRGFFSEARVESLSFLARVFNDPVLTAIWSILGLALGAITGLLGLSVLPSRKLEDGPDRTAGAEAGPEPVSEAAPEPEAARTEAAP